MHPNTSSTPTPEVVAYRYLDLLPVPGRPDELGACGDTDGELFGSPLDLAREVCGTDDYLTTASADWKACGDAALVAAIEAVTGRIQGEPAVLVAVHSASDREVRVFGIGAVACHRLADGDLVTVDAYQSSPGRSALG